MVGPEQEAIGFVPAIYFAPRGIGKEKLEKIALTKTELEEIIKTAKEELEANRQEGSNYWLDHQVDELNDSEGGKDNLVVNFEGYDNERCTHVNVSNIVDVNNQLDDDNDSEAEDEIIKATDNVVLVGHIQDEAASLEFWVFNEDEASLYTHHDFLLPNYPLCIEWLNHDPCSDKPGNMCAIGSMDPVITIWDLDIQDLVVESFSLGSTSNRRSNRGKIGHRDAVLDLSWNKHYEHILASGSVDQTLILWDLDEGLPHTAITCFEDKVQTVEFHPEDAQIILAGSADSFVRLFDCRDSGFSSVKWSMTVEVEKVLWHPVDCNYFIIGSSEGHLALADKRKSEEFLWSAKAHRREISGICFNYIFKHLITSTSIDGKLKIWKLNQSDFKEVYMHDFDIGRLHCMKQCPEDPFTLAFGGEKQPRFRIFNIKNFQAVRKAFDIPEPDDYE